MNEIPGSENALLRWAGKMGTFLGLSVLWILCCLPVLTIIPACVSLYDSVVCCVHGDEPGPYRRFFANMKAELLRGIGLTLLWIVVVLLAVYGFRILGSIGEENAIFSVYTMVYAGSMLIPLAMLAWVIPLQARFRYGFFELHQASLSFAILHLPTTAGVLGLLVLGLLVIFVLPPLLLLMPAILVTMQSALFEKVLKQHEAETLPPAGES
jgi:uncharacterized membrane protein YesL